jgi:NADH-quinone oxidoreductase subunit L
MGGLRKKLPITFWTLFAASLAISGIPPFSGFFSKDAILAAAYEQAPWMYVVGVATAGVTAFYVFRAFFMAFFGEYRGHAHPHESPLVMTLPLMVLAALAVVGGFFNVPAWLAPIFPIHQGENVLLEGISAAVGLAGALLALFLYVVRPALAEKLKESTGGLYDLVNNKYYVDELYAACIVKPLEFISRVVLWHGIDENAIDSNLIDGSAHRARDLGGVLRSLQSGSIRNYAAWVLTGSLLVILIIGLVGGAR